VERRVREVGMRLAALEGRARARVFHLSWWADRLIGQAMADAAFRTRMLRLVDVFPVLASDEDVDAHLREELEGLDLPAWLRAGLGATGALPGGGRLSAGAARRVIEHMGTQFIAGTNPEDVARRVEWLWRRRTLATVDVLGEYTHSHEEADRYASRLAALVEALGVAQRAWPAIEALDEDDLGPVPRASVSVKASALVPSWSFTPLAADEAVRQASSRLMPVLERAAELGVFVWFDMERYDERLVTRRLVRELLERPSLRDLHAGIVVQAYLREAESDLDELVSWGAGRVPPIGIRLVKGAYLDAELVEAEARGWPLPTFERKEETDASFEALVARLHDAHGTVRAAFGTHNLRSLAVVLVEAERRGIPVNGFEIQLLYGMAEPVHEAVRRLGARLRVYAPMGELVPGMAYLVRRLLENTANEGFVRRHFQEHCSLDELLEAPRVAALPKPAPLARRPPTDVRRPGRYRPEPPLELRRPEVLRSLAAAVEAEARRAPRRVLARVGGELVATGRTFSSVNPADPSDVVAEVARTGVAEVDAALAAALEAQERWAATDEAERAAVVFRAAEHLRRSRLELAALEVREVGKSWQDADADVCEAIDVCEYHGRRMLELAQGAPVQSPAGEVNRMHYVARGVVAVVAPWNFPLAIPAGMVVPALLAGNAVVLKPAEQAPVVADALADVLARAGLLDGVLQVLPGFGEDAGAALVADPRVDLVAFTGSKAVGLGIFEALGRPDPRRRSLPRMVAELGGKNAIVVDADADLDEAVPGIVTSAFGFAGQKCSAASRLICVESIAEPLLRRLEGAVRSLKVGDPADPSTHVGPLIDEEAKRRLERAIALLPEVGRLLAVGGPVPERGWFVPPVVACDVEPTSWVATEELFGPLLACFVVRDLEAAIELANAPDAALTAGIYSRSPSRIRYAAARLRAGNVYVNRPIVGAVVGRQPFGGRGTSGLGRKAGGPDTLLEYLDAKVVSENTVRHGVALGDVPGASGPDGHRSQGTRVDAGRRSEP
jgi:RHH-type proline utilization regulon transcriptional repressor/proline dehydrogenase/delta 1-pyrroline-5-carboxylate dehydrogenase